MSITRYNYSGRVTKGMDTYTLSPMQDYTPRMAISYSIYHVCRRLI